MLILGALLFLLALMTCQPTSQKDPWWLKIARKQGPMVCTEEYVKETKRHFATPWTGGKLCGSESIIRYTCCYGYDRVPGEKGCPLVKPLKNLAETAIEAGAKRFIKLADQSSLLPLMNDRGAYTVFATKDSAFLSLTREQEKALNSSKKSRSRPPILLYTIAEGRIAAEDLSDSLTTLYREGSVFITKFSSGLTTVNCIPLIATNLEATNGLIHLTETLLVPPGRNTVADVLVRTPSLSTTASTIMRSQLTNELRDKKPITIFAPTDQAWESLPSEFREALMEDTSSLKALLQYHIVDGIFCSSVIAHESTVKTLEGGLLQVSCNGSGQYVNGARIVRGDQAAGNGFVHHINSVLIPERVRSLTEYLEQRNMKYFLTLAEIGGILPVLKRQDLNTIFIPDDDAFEALSNETLLNLLEDTSLARTVASFHITPGRHLTSSLIDGQRFSTVQGYEPQLRLKMQRKRVSVENALVTKADLVLRNGVIHIIDKVLFPPTITVLQGLQKENFSTFLSLLNQTEPNLLKTLDDSSTTFTIFAPNEAAINGTPPGMLVRLLADPLLLYKTLANHIIKAFIPSNALEPRLIYSFNTVNNSTITVTMENDRSMSVARLAEVTSPDSLAINGVIHEISRLIQL